MNSPICLLGLRLKTGGRNGLRGVGNVLHFMHRKAKKRVRVRDTNDKETSARRETESATALGFTAT